MTWMPFHTFGTIERKKKAQYLLLLSLILVRLAPISRRDGCTRSSSSTLPAFPLRRKATTGQRNSKGATAGNAFPIQRRNRRLRFFSGAQVHKAVVVVARL